MTNAIHLQQFMAGSNAPHEAWEELLTLLPADPKIWLEGDSALLCQMLSKRSMSAKVATLLTQQLGAGAWTYPTLPAPPLMTLLRRGVTTMNRDGRSPSDAALAAIIPYLPGADIDAAILATHEELSPWQKSHAWCGAVPGYWEGHPHRQVAALAGMGFFDGAMALAEQDPALFQPAADGHNLTTLICQTDAGLKAWLECGRSMEAPVWRSRNNDKQEVPAPLWKWLAEQGRYGDALTQFLRAQKNEEAASYLLESRLQGEHWRSAVKNRTWTSSNGDTPMHLIALHRPASFLTSQAKILANKPQLEKRNLQGEDCLSYLIMGLVFNAPEQRKSYWGTAMETFGSVARQIESLHTTPPTRGLLAGVVDRITEGRIRTAINPKWKDICGYGVTSWLNQAHDRVWNGLDRSHAIAMVNSHQDFPKMKDLWDSILATDMGKEEPRFNQAPPEVRLVVMTLTLGGGGRRCWKAGLMAKTLEEPIDLPMPILKALADRVERAIETDTSDYSLSQVRSYLKRERLRVEALMPENSIGEAARLRM
jgi:hypothetical protein